jgi:serine/threonine-protein kinase
MGEVYRALDKNLGRPVAIKILPAAFAEDKERMARFEREAKLLAALNHPNIAAIHGLEESEGRRFLVLELAEGETLQARLDRGPLPVDEALETCREVAEGLEAAHEKGIVHRDLKPGNIMRTPEGKVKILDFGLAKAYAAETTSIDIATSPTITAQMTEPGVILGTAAYMSPEQARSRSVDKRTDIWSFGCVLYECLTGARAFHGETVSDTLAQILKGEPDWSRLPQDMPIRIRTLLRHCLERDPKKRLHDIADARIEIEEIVSQPSAPEAVAIQTPGRAWILSGILCVLAVGALATFISRHLKPTTQPLSPVRFVLKLESGQRLEDLGDVLRPTRTAIAISNNGHFMVYCAVRQNPGQQETPQIYIRRMDQIEAAPVPGTEGGINPFLSPDDQWLGFWADNKLKKVPIAGGVPTILCDADLLFGADWQAGKIVFSAGWNSGLSMVSDTGGRPEVLTAPDIAKQEYGHRLPHFLQGGKGVCFTIIASVYDIHPRLAILDLRTFKWHEVMDDAADGRRLRTGHLVFLRQAILMGVDFDLDRLVIRGRPVPIVANVMQALTPNSAPANTSAGQYFVSDSGWLAYVSGGIFPDPENTLVRVDQKGEVKPVADFKTAFFAPRFSPDGQRIAYKTLGKQNWLWTYDLNRGTRSPLTREGFAGPPAWAPDGKSLAFSWTKLGSPNLFWQPADGSSPMERLATSENLQVLGSFTPDGSTLAFIQWSPETGEDILLLDMKSHQVRAFLNSKAKEGWPNFSPDGHWLAYASNESGQDEVWVRPFPGPGGRWQVSKEGGDDPLWSKDGRQLFYRQGRKVWVVNVQTDGGFSSGKPRLLFEKEGFQSSEHARDWDLWPDGTGFLMVKSDDRKPDPVTEITVVQNWFEEVKRLVPAGKK